MIRVNDEQFEVKFSFILLLLIYGAFSVALVINGTG
jgi:hypothetical protein